MSIQRLREFPDRAIEWFLGCVTLSWGIEQLSIGGEAWGWLAIIAGTVRVLALYVNGAWGRTPIIRVITSFASMFLWFWVVVGMLNSEVVNGLGVFPWFMLGEAFSVYRAGGDAFEARQRRILERMAPRAANY